MDGVLLYAHIYVYICICYPINYLEESSTQTSGLCAHQGRYKYCGGGACGGTGCRGGHTSGPMMGFRLNKDTSI